jgi:hypothetical protein
LYKIKEKVSVHIVGIWKKYIEFTVEMPEIKRNLRSWNPNLKKINKNICFL